MKTKSKIIVIVGPTAVGKSDLAVAIAKKINGEIISADSRQVYRGLDIGSGKISKKEMCGIQHHLLDVYSPKRVFTASKFKTKANQAIEKILKKGKVPIIVGGTGFYIQTIVENISLPKIKPNKDLRKKLNSKSSGELFATLKKMDPTRAKNIDPHNKMRLIRSIELALALGRTPPLKKEKSKYNFIQIGLTARKEVLKNNIQKRLSKRFKQGLVAEVKNLHQDGVSWARLHNLGLEYRWVSLFLQKQIPKSEMIEKLSMEINKYAKRQMTWFKRDEQTNWFTEPQTALEFVLTKLTTK